jgi:molecular chaperone DnaK
MNVAGIDYGTTRAKIATLNETGRPVSVLNSRGEPFTASVAHYSSSGKPLVGTDAVEQGYLDPARTVRYAKLKLGTTENLLRKGAKITATDAVADQIAVLKADLERQSNTKVTHCVPTCPANFTDAGRQALIEAHERNGLEVLRLIPEPTAAGIAYAIERCTGRMLVGIYDFGGGTFDFSLLEVNGGQITVLATQGVAQLGGNDLDAYLRERVLDDIKRQLKTEPTPESDPMLFCDLEQRVERAKFSLAQREEVPIVAAINGKHIVVKVKRTEFHQGIDPLVQQSLDAMDMAMQSAGLGYDQVDRLVMVGGTSRMPFVQGRVAEHTGLVPKVDVDPDKAVVFGAALACGAELAKRGETATFNGVVIPTPELLVSDVTSHAIGCCVLDRSDPKERFINAAIIPKNTRIPFHKTDRFYLIHEDQKSAQIEILQGEPDAERDQCLVIGEITLENLPAEKQRTQRIQLEYVIDANGMVTVTATDTVGGAKKTASVDYKKNIQSGPKPPQAA